MNFGLDDAYGKPPAVVSLNPMTKPNMAAGRYYTYPFTTGTTGRTVVANTLYAVPVFVSEANTFTKIGIKVAATSGNARLGIYNMDYDANPSSLVLDAGALSLGSTGDLEITISQALAPGWYFLACVFDNSSAQVVEFSATGAGAFVAGGPSSSSDMTSEWAPYVALTYGALPNSFGTPTYATMVTAHPVIWVRI